MGNLSHLMASRYRDDYIARKKPGDEVIRAAAGRGNQ